MAFPTNPVDGQIYKKYKYLSNRWELNDESIVTAPLYFGVQRLGFYNYHNVNNGTNQYIHFKTNQTINSIMFKIKFSGYEFAASKPVDCDLSGYPYGPTNSVINVGSYGTHPCGAYKSVDNYVVLTIYVSNLYYLGVVLDQVGAGPQGIFPLTITAATNSASSTGVY